MRKSKKLKLIIFDLDGTLVDAYPAITRSFNYTMKKMGYPKQDAEVIRRAVGWGDINLIKPFIKIQDLKRGISLYRKHHRISLTRYSRLLPGAERLLKALKKRGFLLAIASNRPTQFSWILIRHLRLKKYIDFVLCADKPQNIKPHPQILNKIRLRFSLVPQEILYVGDMAIDARAGRRAKIKTVIVRGGSSTKEEIRRERPLRIMRRIADLLKII